MNSGFAEMLVSPMGMDICAAAIIIILAVIGYNRGFVKSLVGFTVVCASIFLAYKVSEILTPLLTQMLMKTFSEEMIASIDLSKLTITIPVLGVVTLDSLGVDSAELTQNFSAAVTGIVSGIISPLARAILFLLLFIIAKLLLNIAGKAVEAVFTLPIIGSFNRLAGALLGFLKGLAVVFALTALFRSVGTEAVREAMHDAPLLSYLLSINPLELESVLKDIKLPDLNI